MVGAVCYTEQRRARHSAATAHPGSLVCGRIELPEIVEIGLIPVGVYSVDAKEPEIAALISPAGGATSRARYVPCGWRPQSSIRTGVILLAAATHPCPLSQS